ncbi:MAG: hypothetical protein A2X32_05500 [Elusimicrobia bacterium GWC2_64_44]|nr:MAG: hypothetical protein A2X32_05500 [Elusimicrobia bacterium GWC2_64_44]
MLKKKEYLLFIGSLAVLAVFVLAISRNDTARYVAHRLFSKKDTFQTTVNSVSLDKAAYAPGDEILLSLKFEIKDGERVEVRYFENLEHTFSPILYFGAASNGTYAGIAKAELPSRPPGGVSSVPVDNANPAAALTIKGKLTENKDSYIIEFPDLNSRFTVAKPAYAQYGRLWLTGHLMPVEAGIGDALEDSVPAVPLYIVPGKAEGRGRK